MRQTIAEGMMAGATGVMLVAMWHLARAIWAALRAMLAGHRGSWLLWDSARFYDSSRAPPAAVPHVLAVRGAFWRMWPWAVTALVLAIPAALLGGA
ncbi:hypothetical protein ACVFYP_00625 [Roseomonas sp. F4]